MYDIIINRFECNISERTFETSHNENNRNYPLILDNLISNNYWLNYSYKVVFFQLKV